MRRVSTGKITANEAKAFASEAAATRRRGAWTEVDTLRILNASRTHTHTAWRPAFLRPTIFNVFARSRTGEESARRRGGPPASLSSRFFPIVRASSSEGGAEPARLRGRTCTEQRASLASESGREDDDNDDGAAIVPFVPVGRAPPRPSAADAQIPLLRSPLRGDYVAISIGREFEAGAKEEGGGGRGGKRGGARALYRVRQM